VSKKQWIFIFRLCNLEEVQKQVGENPREKKCEKSTFFGRTRKRIFLRIYAGFNFHRKLDPETLFCAELATFSDIFKNRK
jgi:hypothetical protein